MARIKPLADLIESCMGQAFAAQGFASTDIIRAWPGIVGERLARHSRPAKLEWPKRRRGEDGRPDPGSLIVRVESAFALDLQHLAPVLVERVNAHYGWACVGRIVLQQDRIARAPRKIQPPPLDPARRGGIALAVSRIEDEGLRDALDRLGIAVVSHDRLPPR